MLQERNFDQPGPGVGAKRPAQFSSIRYPLPGTGKLVGIVCRNDQPGFSCSINSVGPGISVTVMGKANATASFIERGKPLCLLAEAAKNNEYAFRVAHLMKRLGQNFLSLMRALFVITQEHIDKAVFRERGKA
jgi:hypothetical protein